MEPVDWWRWQARGSLAATRSEMSIDISTTYERQRAIPDVLSICCLLDSVVSVEAYAQGDAVAEVAADGGRLMLAPVQSIQVPVTYTFIGIREIDGILHQVFSTANDRIHTAFGELNSQAAQLGLEVDFFPQFVIKLSAQDESFDWRANFVRSTYGVIYTINMIQEGSKSPAVFDGELWWEPKLPGQIIQPADSVGEARYLRSMQFPGAGQDVISILYRSDPNAWVRVSSQTVSSLLIALSLFLFGRRSRG